MLIEKDLNEIKDEIYDIECDSCSFKEICDELDKSIGDSLCNMAIAYMEINYED